MYRLYREFKFGDNGKIRFQSHFVWSEPSWFGFSLVLEGDLSGKRDYFVTRLKELGVESRPIVAGNFAKNPVAKLMNCVVHGDLPIAEKIDKDGFFIGNSHHDLTKEIEHFAQCLVKIVRELESSCMY